LLDFLARMELRSLTKRVAERFGTEAPTMAEAAPVPAAVAGPAAVPAVELPAIDRSLYVTIRDEAVLAEWLAEIAEKGVVAIDTETTGLDDMQAELVGVSLCTGPGRAAYLPLGHVDGAADLFGSGARAAGQMERERALAMLKPVLEDPAVLKIGQNIKY